MATPVKLDMFDLWIWGLENVTLQFDEVLEVETAVLMFRILNTFAVRVDENDPKQISFVTTR